MKKKIYNIITLIFCILLLFFVKSASAQPTLADTYGYTLTTSDNGTLNCNWVDITLKGKRVKYLSDDNIVGPINIGFDFQYYWGKYDKVWVGSNGYLAFEEGTQISSVQPLGFPNIPTLTDNNSNFIAPLLADLNFDNSNGEVYSYTNGIDTFIVSFINVPFWTYTPQNDIPDTIGSNTFQVILNAADSSVTFQYYQMATQVAPEYQASQNPISIGMESASGNIGVEIGYGLPPSNTCYKIKAPYTPLIQVQDALPKWTMNDQNGGFFVLKNDSVYLKNYIKNGGNTPINNNETISVEITLFDQNNSVVFTQNENINADLQSNEAIETTTNEPFIPQSKGAYNWLTQTFYAPDDIFDNDLNFLEMQVVDSLPNGEITLSYVPDQYTIGGQISWQGGGGSEDGLSVYIQPPFYPVQIIAAEYYILPNGGNITGGFRSEIRDDNGNDNGLLPGDLLFGQNIPLPIIQPFAWNRIDFPQPITLTDGGFFVHWLMEDASIAMPTDLTPPISRRTFEVLSGSTAPYRSRGTEDFFIRAIVKKAPTPINTSTQNWQQPNKNIAKIRTYPNPIFENNTQLNIDFEQVIKNIPNLIPNANALITLTNAQGKICYNEALSIQKNENTHTVSVEKLPKGLYICTLNIQNHIFEQKIILQ